MKAIHAVLAAMFLIPALSVANDAIQLNTDKIDFGDVSLEEKAEFILEVTRADAGTEYSILVDGDEFELFQLSRNRFGVGETDLYVVIFHPKAEMSFYGKIEIQVKEEYISIPMSGSGTVHDYRMESASSRAPVELPGGNVGSAELQSSRSRARNVR